MLTITVSKEIDGRLETVSARAIDEDSTTVSELNAEVQNAISELLDRESA